MANALKVPTSDLTFAEAKEKYAKKLKRIESMKKDKNCWKIDNEFEFWKSFRKGQFYITVIKDIILIFITKFKCGK